MHHGRNDQKERTVLGDFNRRVGKNATEKKMFQKYMDTVTEETEDRFLLTFAQQASLHLEMLRQSQC